MKESFIKAFMLLVFVAPGALAEGWCQLSPGNYQVISHGTKTDRVWINGRFDGETVDKWMLIQDSGIGAASVSIALAAQLAQEPLSLYLDGVNDTCANFESWVGVIRHVRIPKQSS